MFELALKNILTAQKWRARRLRLEAPTGSQAPQLPHWVLRLAPRRLIECWKRLHQGHLDSRNGQDRAEQDSAGQRSSGQDNAICIFPEKSLHSFKLQAKAVLDLTYLFPFQGKAGQGNARLYLEIAALL